MDLATLKQFFPVPAIRPAGGVAAPANSAAATAAPAAAQAGFKLIIEMGGLCVFLPAVDGKSMYVFMPKPLKLPGIPEHQAVVHFLLSDVQGLQAAPEGVEGVWKLSEQHLEIGSPSLDLQAQPDLHITGFDDQNPDPGARLRVPPIDDFPKNRCHFGWVSSLRAACTARNIPGGGTLHRKFVEPTLSPADAAILDARMTLTTGKIMVADFLTGKEGYLLYRYGPFGSAPDASDHRQLVAAQVRYEVDIPEGQVVLRATKLSDPAKVETLTLTPSALSRELTIRILNEEAEAILGTAESDDFAPLVSRDIDRIFETFTQLCPGSRDLAGAVPIPIPEGVAIKTKPGNLHRSIPCSPQVAG